MKQMSFSDTNYGKQNKQKQTLKPIIIRPLMQTRWRKVGTFQILEVTTKSLSPVLAGIKVGAQYVTLVTPTWWSQEKKGGKDTPKVWPLFLWSMTFLPASTLPCIPLYPLGPRVPGLYLPHGWFLPRTGACRCTLLSKIISLFGHILWSQFYAVLFDRSPRVQMFSGLAACIPTVQDEHIRSWGKAHSSNPFR